MLTSRKHPKEKWLVPMSPLQVKKKKHSGTYLKWIETLNLTASLQCLDISAALGTIRAFRRDWCPPHCSHLEVAHTVKVNFPMCCILPLEKT